MKEMDEAYEEQEEEYGSMKDMPLIDNDAYADYLKTYRDTLQTMLEAMTEPLKE